MQRFDTTPADEEPCDPAGRFPNHGNGNGGTSSPLLEHVVFSGNSAGSGGAIFNYGYGGTSSPTIRNGVFSGNSAFAHGGAIYNNAANVGVSSPVLENVTFYGNTAVYDGGAIHTTATSGTGAPILRNSILWGNSAARADDAIHNTSATPQIAYTLIEGSGGSAGWDSALGTDGGGNLDTDPRFLDVEDPDGADDVLGTRDDGLALATGSPAVDAGDNSAVTATADLAGDDRLHDGDGDGTATVDLGAYEWNEPVGLPVELTAFEVVLDADAAELRWRTASEIDNAGFEVEHAPGAASGWQRAGFVDGRGTTTEPQRYAYRIERLVPGRHRFRLKQVGHDGRHAYSTEVDLIVEASRRLWLSAPWPNPARSEAWIAFTVPRDGEAAMRLYDLLGREVMRVDERSVRAGVVHEVRVEASRLPAGVYVVRLAQGDRQVTQRLVLTR